MSWCSFYVLEKVGLIFPHLLHECLASAMVFKTLRHGNLPSSTVRTSKMQTRWRCSCSGSGGREPRTPSASPKQWAMSSSLEHGELILQPLKKIISKRMNIDMYLKYLLCPLLRCL